MRLRKLGISDAKLVAAIAEAKLSMPGGGDDE
jgi:hypothetical protein